MCEDINECSMGLPKCGPMATCVETRGGYECICIEGIDIDTFHVFSMQCGMSRVISLKKAFGYSIIINALILMNAKKVLTNVMWMDFAGTILVLIRAIVKKDIKVLVTSYTATL